MRAKIGFFSLALVALAAAGVWWFRFRLPALPVQVMVLGIDGLDDRVVRRLATAGELPNFARLLREGASGTIRNSELGLPPVSPAIWTTYATGASPEEHGIRGFVFKGPDGWELFRSIHRARPAIWEMLSQSEVSAGVVNWWFSFPPEPIRGFIVTGRYFESELQGLAEITKGRPVAMDAPVIYPESLADAIQISRKQKLPKVLDAESAGILDYSMFELAYRAQQHVPVSVLLLYLNGLDRVSHMTWDAGDIENCGGVEVRKHLRNLDRLLGDLLAKMSPKSHLVVLSDHGFEANPKGKPPGAHESQEAADSGVILLHGPRVEPAKALGALSPYDVLPTLLALLDVPVPEDVRGNVVQQAFRGAEPKVRKQARRRYVRLAAVRRAAKEKAEDAVDAATKERLRALGYLEGK